MKICTSCNLEKPVDEFYKNKRRKDGCSSRCKCCDDASNKVSRSKDKKRYLQYRADYRNQLFERINAWKADQGCKFCSEDEPCCLDLHHLDPTVKEDHPTKLRTSWNRFMKEAEKCEVVCSNCHRKIHAGIIM